MGLITTTNGLIFIDTSRGPVTSSGKPHSINPDKIIGIIDADQVSKSILFSVPSSSLSPNLRVTTLYVTQSGGNAKLGIGTSSPIGSLDIRSPKLNVAPNLTLRTNNDDTVTVGEETGKLRFLIESSSFDLGKLDSAVSGSTAEIFSRVTAVNSSGVKGSLVFGLSRTTTTASIDAFSLGYEIGPSTLSTGDVHAVLSGSMAFKAATPRLVLEKFDALQPVAQIGSVNTSNLNEGAIFLRDSATNDDGFFVIRKSGDSFISGSTGNFGIGTKSPQEPLDVRGGYILSSGSGTSHGFGLSRAGLDNYQIKHLDGGLTIYNATDVRKEMTFNGGGNVGIGSSSPGEKLTVTGNISASNNIYGKTYYASGYEALSRTGNVLVFSNTSTSNQYKGTNHNFGGAPITASIISASGAIIGDTLTGSLNIPNNGTLGIGQQTFYPHGANGFSVNENFDASNSSTQTAYHYTSGNAARSSVVFSIARTNNFTNMFGVTGSSSNNKFVIGAEFANTDFEWRKSLGISPVNLQGGTLLARLDRNGNFYVSNDITASGNVDIQGILSIPGFTNVSSSLASLTAATSSYLTSETYTGTVDTSGTPSANQVAIFADSDTIQGDSGLTYNTGTDKLDADGGYTIDGQSFGTYSAGQGMGFGDDTNVKNSYRALSHLFTTPITASIISASDFIDANAYYVNGNQVLTQPTQGQLDISNDSLSNLYKGTDHNFTTSITSSAEISASGDLYGYDVHAGNNFVLYDNIGVIDETGGNINFGNSGYPSAYKGTSHTFGTTVYLNSSIIKASGAITASGGVSSSFLIAGTADANGGAYSTVMVDTATGRFYHTGSYGGGGGGGGTVTEVTVGTGLDVTNGTTTPNITLDLTEITLSNGLDSTATGLSLDLTEVIANDAENKLLTTDGDGTLTAENITVGQGRMQFNAGDSSTGGFGMYTDLVNDVETATTIFVGDIADIGSAITTTAGYVCNLSGSWAEAQADDVATSTGLLGIATSGASSNRFLLRGYTTIIGTAFQGTFVAGQPIYINANNSGRYAFTPPTSAGHVSRVVGHTIETVSISRVNYYKIYFNPSPDWIEL